MTLKKHILFTLAVLTVTALTAPAMADEAGEIKYRKAVMRSIGGHMGAIVGIIKSSTGNAANFAVHTQGMAHLSKIVGSIFPKGSDFGETEALPAVWEKPAEFAKAVKMLEEAAAKLNTAALSGDMAKSGAAFGDLGKACKNCHENFREKKQ